MRRESLKLAPKCPISRITGNLGSRTHFTGYGVNQELTEFRGHSRSIRLGVPTESRVFPSLPKCSCRAGSMRGCR